MLCEIQRCEIQDKTKVSQFIFVICENEKTDNMIKLQIGPLTLIVFFLIKLYHEFKIMTLAVVTMVFECRLVLSTYYLQMYVECFSICHRSALFNKWFHLSETYLQVS